MKLTLDIETFSRQDLKKGGMAKYAEHESTDILCACWAVDDGPVNAWVPSADVAFIKDLQALNEIDGATYWGEEVPDTLRHFIELGTELHAWNNGFERLNLNGTAGQRYSFPKLEIKNMRCSMANARVHGLPGALEDAANVVASPVKKRLAGINAMRYLCKPRKDGTRPLLTEERERFLQLVPYCADDVRAERAVDNLVPPMSAAEQKNWEMDQEFNDRGWLRDPEVCTDMNVLVHIYKKELDQRCRDITGIKPSRAGPLADWIREHGFPDLENLQADTVRKALMLDLPSEVKTVLKIYSTFNAKAVTKFDAFDRSACADGRIRHMFMFYGAGTGRWSAHHVQNLARPSIDDPETAIAAAKEWDLDWIRTLYPKVDPMKVIGTCVRGALIAAPGKELVFPDFAGVESRYNAWMFGEEWKLEAYRAYDRGEGPNMYCVVYGRLFDVDPNSEEGKAGKQQGKVIDLANGFEGGVGAAAKMCATYRIDLKDMAATLDRTLPRDIVEESVEAWHYAVEQGRTYDLPEKIWVPLEGSKRLWRRAHPRIVSGWKQLNEAAIAAVDNPGQIHQTKNGRVKFKVEDRWLIMRLPSGRRIWYFQPMVHRPKPTKKHPKPKPIFYYMGVDTKTRQWGRTSMYGGSWCNNETQGGCRDLLVRGKLRMRARGRPLIGSVHDEPILETLPGEVSDEEIIQDMCEGQSWDEGLPLTVEIHRGQRYRK